MRCCHGPVELFTNYLCLFFVIVSATDSSQLRQSESPLSQRPSDLLPVLNTYPSESEKDSPPLSCNKKDSTRHDYAICERSREAFEAISRLHDRLDDDHNGSVDVDEANEFFRDQLNYQEGSERTRNLHRNDKHITKTELWKAWVNSPVYNWTNRDVVDWLVHSVELTQYLDAFIEHHVVGMDLPKIAVPNSNFTSITLQVKNPIHRQKLVLKSMDVVLFGPPRNPTISTHMITYLISFVVIFVSIVLVFLWRIHSDYKRKESRLLRQQNDICGLGGSLDDLKQELDKARRQQNELHQEKNELEEKHKAEKALWNLERQAQEQAVECSTSERLRLVEEENERLRDLLHHATHNGGQELLANREHILLYMQLLCEMSRIHLAEKRCSVDLKLNEVRDHHTRLTKKKSGIMGSLRLDLSGNMEQIEAEISQAKDAVQSVRHDYIQHQRTWSDLERLTGMNILRNPGLHKIQQEIQYLRSLPSNAHLYQQSLTRSEMKINSPSGVPTSAPVSQSSSSNQNNLPSLLYQRRQIKMSPCRRISFVRPFALRWRKNAAAAATSALSTASMSSSSPAWNNDKQPNGSARYQQLALCYENVGTPISAVTNSKSMQTLQEEGGIATDGRSSSLEGLDNHHTSVYSNKCRALSGAGMNKLVKTKPEMLPAIHSSTSLRGTLFSNGDGVHETSIRKVKSRSTALSSEQSSQESDVSVLERFSEDYTNRSPKYAAQDTSIKRFKQTSALPVLRRNSAHGSEPRICRPSNSIDKLPSSPNDIITTSNSPSTSSPLDQSTCRIRQPSAIKQPNDHIKLTSEKNTTFK